MAKDNVTFTFRIDSARAQQVIRELTMMLEKLGATSIKTGSKIDQTKTSIQGLGQQSAASAVNFQTATQGMLNLSTAAVQTYTSISNLARANNRAEMSVIAVARAEDLLNNKKQRLNEMTSQGITSGNKYTNMLREVETATHDLTVKTDKMGIEQDAVNDIYMLFATNIANVTISSMQTIVILLGHEKSARLAAAAATKVQTFALRGGFQVQVASNIATKSAIFATTGYSFAALKAAASTHTLTIAVKGLMSAAWPLIAVTAALTAAWAIHESDIIGTKTALDDLMGVEKDFQSVVGDGRDGIEAYDETLGSLGGTLNSDLPKSFEEASKVVIRFNQLLTESEIKANTASTAIQKFNGSIAGGRGGVFIPRVIDPEVAKPQVNQGRGRPSGFSKPSLAGGQQGALAKAISTAGAFLMADPFAGVMAHAEEFGEQPVPTAIPTRGEQIPTGFELQDVTFAGRVTTNIPTDESIANELGIDLQVLQDTVRKQGISAYRLLLAHRIGKGDFLSILEAKGLERLEKGTTQVVSQEMQRQQNIINEAKRIDENFAQEFRKKFSGVKGISIDKLLLEMGELEPERKKRFKDRERTFLRGVGFDLTTASGTKAFAKFFAAGKGAPIDPLDLADIELDGDKTDVSADQYLRFLSFSKGKAGKSIILNPQEQRIFDKLKSGQIAGNRAETLIRSGVDIGNVANSIPLEDALRFGSLQKELGGFNARSGQFVNEPTPSFLSVLKRSRVEGKRSAASLLADRTEVNFIRDANMQREMRELQARLGGRTQDVFRKLVEFGGINAQGQVSATQAFQVPRGSIKTSAENRKRLDIRDANTNLLRFGGRLREGMTIEEEGAVVGGYSSVREFSAASRAKRERGWTEGKALAASFGQVMPSGYISGQGWKYHSGKLANRASEMKSALSSAGLGFKNVGYLNYGYRATAAQAARAIAEHSAAVAYNNNQYAKATQINILEGGFDLSGFRGTSMDLPSLQDKVLQQDDLMKSIGLTRTEAFQIIDTQGRGREEIDDRVKWKSRLSSMSTGTAVL
jgi:hypothetical protein